MAKQKYDYDLIVLGSGGGGSVGAHIAANSGKKVAIVEPGEMGGECPNWGRVPIMALKNAAEIYDQAKNGKTFGIRSGALSYNYPSIKAWKDLTVERTGSVQGQRMYESEGIKVLRGAGHFIGPHEVTVNRRHYTAKNFLVATGTHSYIPPIEGLEKAGYITSKEALNLSRPPKSLFIVGADGAGCELAELFSIFGTKIYLSSVNSRILSEEDEEVSNLMHDVFEEDRGMTVMTNTKVLKVVKDGLAKRVHFQKGRETHTVKVDEILITAGKVANVDIGLENAGVEYNPKQIVVNDQMQTTAKHIYAAGNVVGPYMQTHMAIYQSRIAANNILHKQKIVAEYRAVPRCTFLSPEIASVGLSEEQCIKRDLRIKKAIAPISIIGRANTSNTDKGFVKVITNKDNRLLGACIVSPRAGEAIHELTLAIQHNMSANDIAETIHAFPTWSEAIRIACNKVIREK